MELDRPTPPQLVPPRTGHICVSFDKYMIIWGGYSNYNYHHEVYLNPSHLWMYNTDVGYWLRKTTKGQYPPGTSGATACLLDGQMYMFAGHTMEGNVNSLFKLDLATLNWELVTAAPESSLPSPRDKCVGWTYQNRLYFFGGFGIPLYGYLKDNGEFHEDLSIVGLRRGWNNQLLVFDLETRMWSNPRCKGKVPSSRAAHTSAKVGNVVYVFGGRHIGERMNDLHCLNLDTLTWNGPLVVTGNCPSGRSWHTFTVVSDRQIFLYGGFDQEDIPLNDAWILDIVDLTWTKLDHYTECNPHLWHTACCTREGEVVVFGGCTNNILSNEESTEHSNEVLTFRLQPRSLQRISLEAVYKYRAKTKFEWDFLPQALASWLHLKYEVTRLNSMQDELEKIKDTGQPVGSTCTVA